MGVQGAKPLGLAFFLSLIALSLPLPAAALHLSYAGSLAGIPMIRAELELTQDDTGYLLHTSIHAVGAFAVVARGGTEVISQGVWQGASAAPTHVDSEGYWNGQQRRLVVEYRDGVPTITVMVPADARRRAKLAREDIAGTTDAFGLVVGLIRQVGATGRCDRHARVFDGRGVADFTMSPGAPGTVLRCDFATRKVAGLQRWDNPKRTDRGYVVFASPAPGLPMLPTRIVVRAGWTGDAVLALTAAS